MKLPSFWTPFHQNPMIMTHFYEKFAFLKISKFYSFLILLNSNSPGPGELEMSAWYRTVDILVGWIAECLTSAVGRCTVILGGDFND